MRDGNKKGEIKNSGCFSLFSVFFFHPSRWKFFDEKDLKTATRRFNRAFSAKSPRFREKSDRWWCKNMSLSLYFFFLLMKIHIFQKKKNNNLFYSPPSSIYQSIDRTMKVFGDVVQTHSPYHMLSYRWITCCRTDGSLPVVRLGDVSELLLDSVSVDIDEPEGLRGGSGKSAPLGRVPSPGGVPDGVQARGLDLLDRLLDSIKAGQKCRVGLRKCDVQQLLVVVFVLNNFEVRGVGSEKHHFGRFLFLFSSEKEKRRPWASRDFGSARKTLPWNWVFFNLCSSASI